VRRIAQADALIVRWAGVGDSQPEHTLATDGTLPGMHGHGDSHSDKGSDKASHSLGEAQGGLKHTVPASLHHRVLGEIDLFYRTARPLDDEERSLFEALASHLAGGIESLRAAAAERTVLAQELHDSIAQSLAFLKIQVDLLRTALRRDDAQATQRVVGEIDEGVRESYAHVRELLLHFRTRASERDIEAALRLTLQKFERQTGLQAQLRVEGHGSPLPGDVQVQVLHVLQEALSNVRKHAGAHAVQVHVQRAPAWRFEVVDDGCGFDDQGSAGHEHVGLRIMQERARRVGGTVTIDSHIGQGTRVEIVLPGRPQVQEVVS
jgi:two-component system nitrate/nitrite sensor histidine kinase NarX